jgi:NADH-quinone oxidoreductase subunit N
MPPLDWAALSPAVAVAATGLLLLAADLLMPRERRNRVAWIPLLGFGTAGALSAGLWGGEARVVAGMLVVDRTTCFFYGLFAVIGILTVLLSVPYLRREGIQFAEYYVLLTFAVLGMMVMASSADLLMFFLGLETLSVALYVLAGFLRQRVTSNESGLKYLLLGAFSSAFLLYGVAFLYGATGSTNLEAIRAALIGRPDSGPFPAVGVGLILVGLAFKVAAVPFHMWAPDVYEGAPTSVTAFMIAGTKAAAFAGFLRVTPVAVASLEQAWPEVLWVLAALTMGAGNVAAIAQRNLKRMLAYSGIAHAGYLLVALVAGSPLGTAGLLFYLLAYAFMTVGAFAVLIALGQRGEENLTLEAWAGMGYRRPLFALSMAIFMFSLAGLPPTAGFMAKFYVFSAAVEAGYYGLAILGVLCSVVSVFFYLRVVVVMYMLEPAAEPAVAFFSPAASLATLLGVAGTLHLGLFPAAAWEVAVRSVQGLGGVGG